MNPFDLPPVAAVLDTAYNVIAGLSGILASIAPGWGAALAVIVTTVSIRAALIPLGVMQVRAQLRRAALAPRLAALQRRYAKNPERLQRETLQLYRSEGVSPFAGMLPAIAQLPLISTVYALFTLPVIAGHANGLLGEPLLGVALGQSWITVLGSATAWPHALVGLALLGVLAVTAWASRRQTLRTLPPAADPRAASMARFGASLSFITVAVGVFVPLAASLYLAVSTAWTLAERTIVRRALTATPAG